MKLINPIHYINKWACGITYRWNRRLPLEMRQRRRIVSHVGEDEPLLVVVLAQYFVLAQIKPISNAEPATSIISA